VDGPRRRDATARTSSRSCTPSGRAIPQQAEDEARVPLGCPKQASERAPTPVRTPKPVELPVAPFPVPGFEDLKLHESAVAPDGYAFDNRYSGSRGLFGGAIDTERLDFVRLIPHTHLHACVGCMDGNYTCYCLKGFDEVNLNSILYFNIQVFK